LVDIFLGEIRMFGLNFAPTGWALCNGQLLPISQNTALFSLLGTFYGGNGQSTFALPDLQGMAPMFWGQGPGLSVHDLGETGGTEMVTLLESEIPAHAHQLRATNTPADVSSPTGDTALARSTGAAAYHPVDGSLVTMNPQTLGVAGGSLPHNNLMPYLVMNFCIALQGTFPPRW
jgi:microcystin-dependent protein